MHSKYVALVRENTLRQEQTYLFKLAILRDEPCQQEGSVLHFFHWLTSTHSWSERLLNQGTWWSDLCDAASVRSWRELQDIYNFTSCELPSSEFFLSHIHSSAPQILSSSIEPKSITSPPLHDRPCTSGYHPRRAQQCSLHLRMQC
jgi:hypothetical protein